MNEQTKIIFTKRILLELMELGFNPIETLQNPLDNRYLCWKFEDTEEFERALCNILGRGRSG